MVATPAPEASFLGFGLLRPFRRDRKGDFASGSGVELIKAAIGQILGTQAASETTQGELPWRPEFGSLLHLIRHAKGDEATIEIARAGVVEAIRRWESRISITSFQIEPKATAPGGERNALEIKVRFAIAPPQNSASNRVFFPDATEETATITI